MSDFSLDLRSVEDHIEEEEEGEGPNRIELGVLDGTTPDREWIDTVEEGAVLVLNVDGDVNELAAGFARDVKDGGGELVHFRGFLLVAPPGVSIDTDRLG
ncbi:hypothetical protein G9464_13975 [Halostella sp. JP-L12]|uniref:DUF5779 family protein n=1 Tax=Halostella TaxID=1843185 RepID=UPI000EF7E98A|nr:MULTISPECIES: DUF5779 family protein [Halostella]NHN48693.1 hypothetical protein [Halostella sp. JP-L12]